MPEITHTANFTTAIAFGPALFTAGSSNVKAIQYSHESNILRVAFKSGASYLYFGVPAEVYEEASEEEVSTGQWLNTQIKGKYAYLKEGVAA